MEPNPKRCNTHRQSTTRIHDLPREILCEILSRLPAESLISNKVVSKFWYNCISDNKFVDAHLTRSRHQWEYQQILVSKHSKHELINFTQAKYQVSKLDFELEKYLQIESSCDGLLLFSRVYDCKQMYVLNPATHKCRVLPILVTDDKVYITDWTLIYDTSIQKYKVVGISMDMKRCYLYTLDSYHSSNDDDKAEQITNVAIWREVVMPYEESFTLSEPMMVNNKLHWLGSIGDSKKVIMYTMDVSKEEIVKTKVPFLLQTPYIWGNNAIIELMGSLCLTDYSANLKQLDIWTLLDAGKGQWTKRIIPYNFKFLKGHVVRTSICQNRILVSSKNRIYIYDLKNKDWQTIRLPVQANSNAYFVHTNSLVKWG